MMASVNGAEDVSTRWGLSLERYRGIVNRLGRKPRQIADPDEAWANSWAKDNRQRHSCADRSPLSAEQCEALQSLPFWFWRVDSWDTKLERYLGIVVRLGRRPRRVGDSDEVWANKWARVNRDRESASSRTPLSAAQRTALESTPFWYWSQKGNRVWEMNLDRYREIVGRLGRPPRKVGEADEIWAYRWAQNLRSRGSATSRSPLSAAQRTALEATPFWVWTAVNQLSWNAGLERYRVTATRIGRSPKHTSTDDREQAAGRWAAAQRARHAGTNPDPLTPAQITALELVPYWYWTTSRADSWHSRYLDLAGFVTEYHRFPSSSSSDSAEKRAARWAETARLVARGYARGTLTPERVALLEGIPGWFWESVR